MTPAERVPVVGGDWYDEDGGVFVEIFHGSRRWLDSLGASHCTTTIESGGSRRLGGGAELSISKRGLITQLTQGAFLPRGAVDVREVRFRQRVSHGWRGVELNALRRAFLVDSVIMPVGAQVGMPFERFTVEERLNIRTGVVDNGANDAGWWGRLAARVGRTEVECYNHCFGVGDLEGL
jgi:hypothetical protein